VFTLGGTELLLIGVLALLLFGPDKIPQIARTVGRFMREFNKYKDIMESTFRSEMSRAEAEADDGSDDGLEKIGKAAQASRDFAAERGTEIATLDEEVAAAKKADPDPVALTVTDEEEEEE
jgi:TatA/E family protein of Tat protein translocase